jgi:flagellar hook-associated protein 3 FlgL
VVTSERSRADFQKLDQYSNNIDIANRRIKMMTTALEKIKEQAGNVVNAIEIQTQKGEFEIDSVKSLAANVSGFLHDLINEKDGDRYLFGGSDTLSQPLTDTGTLDTYLQTQINNWINGTIDTDQLVDSYTDRTQLNDSTTGYSAQLSGGTAKKVFVRVDEATELDYTVFANDDGLRDIVAAVDTLKNLTKSIDVVSLDPNDPVGTVSAPGADQKEQNDNFFQVFNDLAAKINGALDRVDQLEFDIGNVQSQIDQIKNEYKQEKVILQGTISNVEDADINEVAVKLNALSTQLQASYQVTGFVQQLSLANFLGNT